MWIRSEEGKLYNLDNIDSVEIHTTSAGHQVVAHLISGNRTVPFTDVKDNDVEPRAVVKRIATAIIDNDRILDLERSYSTIKKHRYQEKTV
jgi:hypothetical protein